MCQICVDLLDHYFPELSHDEKMEIMWGETAFPFVDPQTVEGKKYLGKQLEEAKCRRAFVTVKEKINNGENLGLSELASAMSAKKLEV